MHPSFRLGTLRFTLLLAAGIGAGFATTAAADQATPRIIGGSTATPGDWPWQVAILDRTNPDNYAGEWCGGTLIRPDWVLTAAHCLAGTADPAGAVDVLVKGYDLSNPASGTRVHAVRAIIHPSYDAATTDNDVALIQLASSFDGPYVRVTEPSPGPETMVGTLSTLIGWGDTSGSRTFPNLLQQVQVPIVDSAICNAAASYNGGITPNMFCAGYPAGGKDTCQGDSGGPLVVPDAHSQWVQVGITSWGNGCAQPNYYGVYTRIANYSSWISSQVGKVPTTTSVSAARSAGTRRAGYAVSVQVAATTAGYGAPTGTVQVRDGGGHSCTVNLPQSTVCYLNSDTVTGALSAAYSGDTTFDASGYPAVVPVLAPWAFGTLISGLAALGAGAACRRRSEQH